MMTFHILVVVAVVSSMLVWVALSLYVLAIDRRRVNARQIVDVAIGVAGIAPLADWRGLVDSRGHELRSTVIAVADEIASAAELVMGKLVGVPAAVVRGLEVRGQGSARELVMPSERNLFA